MPITDTIKNFVVRVLSPATAEPVAKFNPNHDERGRFTSEPFNAKKESQETTGIPMRGVSSDLPGSERSFFDEYLIPIHNHNHKYDKLEAFVQTDEGKPFKMGMLHDWWQDSKSELPFEKWLQEPVTIYRAGNATGPAWTRMERTVRGISEYGVQEGQFRQPLARRLPMFKAQIRPIDAVGYSDAQGEFEVFVPLQGQVLDSVRRLRKSLELVTKAFDPSQPRDEDGKWTEGNGQSVTLYRGDSAEVVHSLSHSDPLALFGAGIYLTDSKRIANDYRVKGAETVFRVPNVSKDEAIERYISRLERSVPHPQKDQLEAQIQQQDAAVVSEAHKAVALAKGTSYEKHLTDWASAIEKADLILRHKQQDASPELVSTLQQLVAAKDQSQRLAQELDAPSEYKHQAALAQWDKLKDTLDIRKMVDGSVVFRKQEDTGVRTELEVPQSWVKHTVDAEAEITPDVTRALAETLSGLGDVATAADVRDYSKRKDEDGFRPSFRRIYTSIVASSPLTTEKGQQVWRAALKALGYKGIRYAGGMTMGGGPAHTAYVFWDEQGMRKLQRQKVEKAFDPSQPRDEDGKWTDSGSASQSSAGEGLFTVSAANEKAFREQEGKAGVYKREFIKSAAADAVKQLEPLVEKAKAAAATDEDFEKALALERRLKNLQIVARMSQMPLDGQAYSELTEPLVKLRQGESAYKRGEQIGRLPKLGPMYRAEGSGPLFRGVTQEDWYRIEEQGYVDTDGRGSIVPKEEGMNLTERVATAVDYIPHGDTGIVLALDVSDTPLFLIEPDGYVRTSSRIPLDKVIAKSPYLMKGGDGLVYGSNFDYPETDEHGNHLSLRQTLEKMTRPIGQRETVAKFNPDQPRDQYGRWIPGSIDTPEFKQWFDESQVRHADGKPRVVYHGTVYDFDSMFDTSKGEIGAHFAEHSGVADYFSANPPRFKDMEVRRGGKVFPVYLSIQNPLRMEDPGSWSMENVINAIMRDYVGAGLQQKDFDVWREKMQQKWDESKGRKFTERNAIIREMLEHYGYDGIKYLNRHEGDLPQEVLTMASDEKRKLSDREFKVLAPKASISWIALRPSQIKSVWNKGSWDKTQDELSKAEWVIKDFDEGSHPRAPKGSAEGGQFVSRTETPEFKAWFTDSKVASEDGKPLVVYSGHSNAERFGAGFDPKKATAGAFYFTEDPKIASNYATGKMGVKEVYENGDQYRLAGANGKFSKKIWQVQLTPEQVQKAREFFADESNGVGDIEAYIQENKAYDADAARAAARGGIKDLFSVWKIMESMGYNIAYADDGDSALFLRQNKNSFEELLDHVGIKWQSADWSQPGVFPVYLSIRKPLDASNPPKELLDDLHEAVKGKRTASWDKVNETHWTRDYPLKNWVEDLDKQLATGEETFWATQVPKDALPILRRHGFDGIKDTGGKMGGPAHTVWIAFDPGQVKSSIANKGTYDRSKAELTKTWDESEHPRSEDGKFTDAVGAESLGGQAGVDAAEARYESLKDEARALLKQHGHGSAIGDAAMDRANDGRNAVIAAKLKRDEPAAERLSIEAVKELLKPLQELNGPSEKSELPDQWKPGKKIGYSKDLGDIFETKGSGVLFRSVSLKDWERIQKQGYIDSDARMAISREEGMNLTPYVRSAASYINEGEKAVILAIDSKDVNLFMIRPDSYIRTHDKVPLSKVVAVSEVMGNHPDAGLYVIRNHPASKQVQTAVAKARQQVLPAALAGAKPRYGYGSKLFKLEFANDIDKALYIIGGARSKRHAKYLSWLEQATGLTVRELKARAAKLRAHIKQQARVSAGETLVITGLWDRSDEDDGLLVKSYVQHESSDEYAVSAPVAKSRDKLDGIAEEQAVRFFIAVPQDKVEALLKSAELERGQYLASTPTAARLIAKFNQNHDERGRFANGTGVASGKAQTDTPEFKTWFADSKAVDAKGKPLVVYHGTKQSFASFSNRTGARGSMGDSVGFYFTDSTELASDYAESGHIVPSYLSIQNPLQLDSAFINREQLEKVLGVDLGGTSGMPDRAEVYWFFKNGGAYDGHADARVGDIVASAVKAKGYDGVIFKERHNRQSATVYLVFRPEQVKSATGNNGRFDPKESDITKSQAPVILEVLVKRGALGRSLRSGAASGPGVYYSVQKTAAGEAVRTHEVRPGGKAGKLPVLAVRPFTGSLADAVPLAKDFDEGKHPRDERGRFAESAGSSQTDSPEFKAWFGKSKVVDRKGQPLVVYHGTAPTGWEWVSSGLEFKGDEPFSTFRQGLSYFAENAAYASGFAQAQASERALGNKARVYPVYLSIKNPYDARSDNGYWKKLRVQGDSVVSGLIAAGYDGILMTETEDEKYAGNVWVAINPNQVKSAIGNNGRFDPADADITKSQTEQTVWAALTLPAEELSKANPNHDPQTGRFTSGGGTLYHGTTARALESILQSGLTVDGHERVWRIPSTSGEKRAGSVFASASEQSATRWADMAVELKGGTAAVVEIRVPAGKSSIIEHDEHGGSDDRMIVGGVPAEWIVSAKVAARDENGRTRWEAVPVKQSVAKAEPSDAELIAKFNDNHDPETGRFSSGGGSITAYHGTPYDVDHFTTGKVGTGEGHQSYGWGLYFADTKDVAQYYADVVHDDAMLDRNNARMVELARVMEADSTGGYRQFRSDTGRKAAEEYDRLMEQKLSPGRMYTVKLNVGTDELLNWDASIHEQPKAVQKLAEEWLHNRDQSDELMSPGGPVTVGDSSTGYARQWKPTATGKDLYQAIENKLGPRVASEKFASVGISGLRYFDQNSRMKTTPQYWPDEKKWAVEWAPNNYETFDTESAAQKYANRHRTSNYVIWDESKVEITHKNGQPVSREEALAKSAEWHDELHPRDERGRFASGDKPQDQRLSGITKESLAQALRLSSHPAVSVLVNRVQPHAILQRPHTIVEGQLSQDGKPIGTFAQLYGIDPQGKFYVDLTSLEVDKAHQGSGIGSEFVAQAESAAQQMGASYLTLVANCKVGGLAWALHGYDFASDAEREEVANTFKAELTQRLATNAMDSNEHAASVTVVDGLRHSWQFAAFGTASAPRFGRETLLAKVGPIGWAGRKDIGTDSEGWKLGQTYQQLKASRGN